MPRPRWSHPGVIWILALTQVFTAGPELAPAPFVSRVSETPATETVVCALTVETPVVGDVMVVWQLPVPPAVVHCAGGFGVLVAPLLSTVVNVITVPSGALTGAVAVVDVDMGGEGVRCPDPVGPVRGDLDVRIDDLQRLTGTVGADIGRVTEVVGPEGAEAGRVDREREPGRVELTGSVERPDRARVLDCGAPEQSPFRNQSTVTFPVGTGLPG